jgi:hypothetical protein
LLVKECSVLHQVRKVDHSPGMADGGKDFFMLSTFFLPFSLHVMDGFDSSLSRPASPVRKIV